MVQKVRLQDGVIVYTGVEDGDPIYMGVRGEITVTDRVVIGESNTYNSYIRKLGSGTLSIVAEGGSNLALSTNAGVLTINGIRWPSVSAVRGSFLATSNNNTLQFYPFIAGVNQSDTLTSYDLSALYTDASVGQVVLGPNVMYYCTGPGSWRVIAAPPA